MKLTRIEYIKVYDSFEAMLQSPAEVTTQAQFITNWKSFFQLAGTILKYSEPKCTPKHLGQGTLKTKIYILLPYLAAARGRFTQESSLTEAKIS